VVILDPAAEVDEVSLVFEHVVERERVPVPVGVRDVIAVSSVREILTVLRDADSHDEDLSAPGRLARRLEFSSLIVLIDLDDADSADATLVRAFLAALSPAALVASRTQLAHHRPSRLLTRGRAHRIGSSMGWQRHLADAIPSTSGSVTSWVFRDPRPFHPQRLHDAVVTDLEPGRVGHIMRSRGFARLATRPDQVGSWSSAGGVLDLDPTAMQSWHAESPIGQELVFIGLGLNIQALEDLLGHCLLTADELIAAPAVWASYPDPFPAWTSDHHH
jgi:G3E family GTPase